MSLASRNFNTLTDGSTAPKGRILVLATHNTGKVHEIEALLQDVWPGEVRGAADVGLTSPAETAGTFKGNAALKAEAACIATGEWALADDSGLCVDALGGAPGVETANYGGPAKLLAALEGIVTSERRGRFVCTIALARPGEKTLFFTGEMHGHIPQTAHGENGFGYDPVFIPTEHTRTFAEMDKAEKGRLSHRGKALAALAKWLQSTAA